ncbi:MAG: CapA family protein [Roseiarcus sp.]|jgi:poly-gamma-glutamate synthesis protein (capsule biosynthesis protein)
MTAAKRFRVFLCGDVMTGRGVDQIMAHPSDPELHESGVATAIGYVRLAEAASGAIPRRVAPTYVWGAALDELRHRRPDLRIVNLETSVTRSGDWEPKGINYRMSPENADCLTAAGVDCCVLANNHVLDWGRAGLVETLDRLAELRIATAGAGRDLAAALAPAALPLPGSKRALVFAYASPTSGVPEHWAAGPARPGVALLEELGDVGAERVADEIARWRRQDDLLVVSIHWGSNWGYQIPAEQRRFAHALIDKAGISILHGHSSHHPRAIDVYKDRPILYGCGDFLNDYEGIGGYEGFRGDLPLMVFADFDADSGALAALTLTPLRIRRFRLERPSPADVAWLGERLGRECGRFGGSVTSTPDGSFGLVWTDEIR